MNSSNLKFIKAESFYKKVTDGTHDSPKSVVSGKKLITSKHIKGNEIDFSSAYLISNDDFYKINIRSAVEQWDVIVSMIGTIGLCYLEKNSKIDYAVKNVGLFKTGSEIEGKWLYYYLISSIGKKYLHSVKLGTTQPYLTLDGLRKLPILVPENNFIKVKIINFLSALDKRIYLNNNINQNLEATARCIYDYWFLIIYLPFFLL